MVSDDGSSKQTARQDGQDEQRPFGRRTQFCCFCCFFSSRSLGLFLKTQSPNLVSPCRDHPIHPVCCCCCCWTLAIHACDATSPQTTHRVTEVHLPTPETPIRNPKEPDFKSDRCVESCPELQTRERQSCLKIAHVGHVAPITSRKSVSRPYAVVVRSGACDVTVRPLGNTSAS